MQIYFSEKRFCGLNCFVYLALKLENMAVEIKTPEEQIVEHLENNGQKMNWLADKIGLSAGHLHSVLKGEDNVKRELTEENLKKINEALGTKFKK